MIKRNISCIYEIYTLLLPGQVATKARMDQFHVVTVFNFPGTTRDEKKREYETNSPQVSYKLAQKIT